MPASNFLVGTAPDQVPTNADLGEMAFQSKDAVEFTGGKGGLSHLDITAVSAQLSVNATAVFVYDTSKDSDGGAWRDRCQSMSWYSEPLNTATRGARREFPSVAVIVATANSVTIYDGDSPDLPMWMVFTVYYSGYGQGAGMIGNVSGAGADGATVTGVSCLNAQMWIAKAGNYSNQPYAAVNFVDFLADIGGGIGNWSGNGTPYVNARYLGDISERNRGLFYYTALRLPFGSAGILANNPLGVAVTVMPNAPIDAVTKLPVLTVAIATLGGVSIIRDDRVQLSLTTSNWANCFGVKFSGTVLYAQQGNYYWFAVDVSELGSSITGMTDQYGGSLVHRPVRNVLPATQYQYLFNSAGVPGHKSKYDFVQWVSNSYQTPVNNYLQMISTVPESPWLGMSHTVTTKYASGWMHGDIKGAWLSDTAHETVQGTNLAVNGDISNGSSGWATGNSGVLSVSNGQLVITGNGGNFPSAKQVISVVPGRQYLVQVDMAVVSGNVAVNLEVFNGTWIQLASNATSTMATYHGYVTAVSSTLDTRVTIYSGSNLDSTYSAKLDNLIVTQVQEDRSISGRGLQVVGSISKTPVAPEADLVGYSNFSNSNYFVQPYQTAYNFGTGDFAIMGWARSNSDSASTQGILFRGGASGERGVQILRTTSNGATYTNSLWVDVVTATESVSWSNGLPFTYMPPEEWNFIVVLRRGGMLHVYFNGVIVGTNYMPGSISPTGTPALTIGNNNVTSNVMTLALWRISATAPTDEQVKKIYADELELFRNGAKATLYGAPGNVNALAFDDDTKLLHAGTASGRSVFQGLRRVDNTTTAVSAVISAASGLVVEN